MLSWAFEVHVAVMYSADVVACLAGGVKHTTGDVLFIQVL